MSDSIPLKQLAALVAILKEVSGCSQAPIYTLLHKYLPAILDELQENTEEIRLQTPILLQIADALTTETALATSITFKENSMLPTTGGNTLVYTGTLSPSGSVLASDFVATVTSNDPAVLPTVDSTGLVVSIPLPTGWVESTTTPLAIAYATTSASTGQALSATITPSAQVVLATSVTFAQTT